MSKQRLRPLLLVLAGLLVAWPVEAQYGYHFGRNKIQYDEFDWHILKTEHFDIYFYPEMQQLAEHGAYFAEEVYDELQNKFNFSLNHRVPLIFYSSNLHFKQTNITPGFIPDGVGGFFEFMKGRVVLPANGNIHQFRRVIRHELVHVFTYMKALRVLRDHRIPPDRFLPLWFTEGIAEYWSGTPDHQHEMLIRDAVYSNYLVPLGNLYRIYGTYLMYKQGEGICRFISETYGEEKLLQLIEEFWKDRDFEKVMEMVLREDFHAIDARWQDWLKKTYIPQLDDVDLPSYVTNGLAVEGFNAKPAFYRFRDGRRKVYFVANRTGYSNVYQVEVDSLYRPIEDAEILVHGERSDDFEAFHLFESRLSVSAQGKLAFVTKSGKADVVHVYDLERDEMEATYGFDGLVAVYSPDWSPDGTRLVFSSIDRSGFSDLYTFDTTDGRLTRLTNDSYDDRDPAWSPDGTRIVFSSDRTSEGKENHYNLFTFDLADRTVAYVTFGERLDFSPRWSPDGTRVIFTSTQRDSLGRWGAQDVWVADVPLPASGSGEVASAATLPVGPAPGTRTLRRLTHLTAAAFDPVWTADGDVLFTSFEHYRFTIRHLAGVDSILTAPEREERIDLAQAGGRWTFDRISVDDGAQRLPYRRKYQLDLAQGVVSQNAIWGTSGGAVMAFSDMMGDDHWYLMLYSNSYGQSDFLRSLNLAVTRVQLAGRTNVAYGLFRYGGLRYDITDPDASREYPVLWETMYGGHAGISYPLSMFRRVEIGTSLAWSDKQITITNESTNGPIDREALLLSNSVSLVHDNALYGMNGPVDGWRANVTAAYTTDLVYSNVSYYTLSTDVRHYLRLGQDVTFASRGFGLLNRGREARLGILGGSWDLRGYRLFSVRGEKMWFMSHELRFPLLKAPGVIAPILAPFGLANVRGALFVDAAHAWNDDYRERALEERSPQRRRQLNIGETIGSAGVGFRFNLFGGFVLRYDIGYRYRDGFREQDGLFRQFFFGYDF